MLHNSEQNAEECDATGLHSRNAAGSKKTIHGSFAHAFH